MEVELSSGSVAAIWEGEVAREMPLVLQVLLLPMCSCAERPEPGWYHAALSDGAHQIYGHLRLDETASAAVRAAPLGYGAVVRLFDFETRTNIEGLRCASLPTCSDRFFAGTVWYWVRAAVNYFSPCFFWRGRGMFTMGWFRLRGVFPAPGCCPVGQRVGWGGFAVPCSYGLVKMRIWRYIHINHLVFVSARAGIPRCLFQLWTCEL